MDTNTSSSRRFRTVGAGAAITLALVSAACAEVEEASPPTEAPTTVAATDAPAETDPPATDPPATDPPVTEPVATDPPTTEPVATEPPATDPPATDAPAATEPESEADAPPIPTLVIGQDEFGDDIVVPLEISEVCAQTFHEPLDADSFSFIRWTYQAPGLAPGTTVDMSGSDGFSQFTKVLDDRTIVVEQGITSYGDYDFPTAGWGESETVSATVDPDGFHTVDDTEGEASETCVS